MITSKVDGAEAPMKHAICTSIRPTEAEAVVQFVDKCRQSNLVDAASVPGDSRAGIDDEIALLRFLRAKKYDVDAAYAQYEEARQVHHENNILVEYDNMDILTFDEARNMYPHWTGRVDKRGQPICIFDVASLNEKRLAEFASSTKFHAAKARPAMIRAFACFDGLTRFVLPFCNMARTLTDGDPPVSACLYIADISALSLKQVWSVRRYVQDISKLLANNYPELIDKILVIGAPAWFPKLWSWVKGWIDPVTADKIKFVPGGAALAQMSELMDVEGIPERYGGKFEGWHGTLPDLDEGCRCKLEWVNGVDQTIPIGPLKWAIDEEVRPILLAVGTEDGKARRTKIATMTSSIG